MLTEAFFTIEPVALGFQQYPDLNKMSAERLDEFLTQTPSTDVEKVELRAESDKVRYYGKIRSGYDPNKAAEVYNAFHKNFAKNGIFIMEPLKTKFAEIDGMLKDAVIERQVLSFEFNKASVLHREGRALLKALEEEVQRRLWSSQRA